MTAHQTFTCQDCGTVWTRPVSRGRPPLWCDDCRRKPRSTTTTTTTTTRTTEREEKREENGPRFHKSFPVLLSVAKARIPAMLVGPAGSGKSTACRQVSEALNLSFVTESCSPQMSKWDLMGFMAATGEFTPGVCYEPFKNGGVVLLDEIDASNPAVLVSINLIASVAVGETVTFPNGENVPRHPDFVLVTGANTFGNGASDEYVGREQLDAATLDRFATIEWLYDEALEFAAAGPDAHEWVEFVQRVRLAAKVAGVELLVTPRASINGAALLRQGMNRRTVEMLTVWKGVGEDAIRTVRAQLRAA